MFDPRSTLLRCVAFAGGVPAWTVAHATIRAHSSKMLCCASGGSNIATASKYGSVRLWDVGQLRSQALQQVWWTWGCYDTLSSCLDELLP